MLSKYLLIIELGFDAMLYYKLGKKFWCGPYKMLLRAAVGPQVPCLWLKWSHWLTFLITWQYQQCAHWKRRQRIARLPSELFSGKP